jgi:hypothetical protein
MYATALNNLAVVYRWTIKLHLAEPLYRQAPRDFAAETRRKPPRLCCQVEQSRCGSTGPSTTARGEPLYRQAAGDPPPDPG